MSLFKKETHKLLEPMLQTLRLNAENNYRDATLENLDDLEKKFNELKDAGKLNDKQISHYTELIANYRTELKGFTHKEQKAGW